MPLSRTLAALSLAVCAAVATPATPLVVCSSSEGLHGVNGAAFTTVAPPATANSSFSFFGLVAVTSSYTYFTSEGQNQMNYRIRRMRHETREIIEIVEMQSFGSGIPTELLVDEDGDWMVWTEYAGTMVRSCRLSNCTATATVQSTHHYPPRDFQWVATGIVGMAFNGPMTDTNVHLLNLETGSTSTTPSSTPACPVPGFRDPNGFLWNTCNGVAYRAGILFPITNLQSGEFVHSLTYEPVEMRLVFVCGANTICVTGTGPSNTVEFRHTARWVRGCGATTPAPIPNMLVVGQWPARSSTTTVSIYDGARAHLRATLLSGRPQGVSCYARHTLLNNFGDPWIDAAVMSTEMESAGESSWRVDIRVPDNGTVLEAHVFCVTSAHEAFYPAGLGNAQFQLEATDLVFNTQQSTPKAAEITVARSSGVARVAVEVEYRALNPVQTWMAGWSFPGSVCSIHYGFVQKWGGMWLPEPRDVAMTWDGASGMADRWVGQIDVTSFPLSRIEATVFCVYNDRTAWLPGAGNIRFVVA
eukprot:m51a1_g4587 hypothetical protein (529) ;mRNA; r:182952-184612